MHALSKGMAMEFAADNIRVNAIAPGLILTPFHEGTPRERLDSVKASVPLNRLGLRRGPGRLVPVPRLDADERLHHRRDHRREWRPADAVRNNTTSCPGLCRASTTLTHAQPWMAGTSPATTLGPVAHTRARSSRRASRASR